MKEITLLLGFLLLSSLFKPTFQDFQYFFLLDVIHISKFTFAILQLVAFMSALGGALIYKAYFKDIEIRSMITIGLLGNIFSAFLNFCFAKRWNLALGLNDHIFLFSTQIIQCFALQTFLILPIMVLFAKVTPKKIEGTMYALLTGTLDFCNEVIQPVIGSLINNAFVHVQKDDLSSYSSLCLLSLLLTAFNLLVLPLIPTSAQIEEYRIQRKRTRER